MPELHFLDGVQGEGKRVGPGQGDCNLIYPLVIFLTRVIGIFFGTMRLIAIRDMRDGDAFGWGFVEMLLFVASIGLTLNELTQPWNIGAYALGFSVGTYLAMKFDRMVKKVDRKILKDKGIDYEIVEEIKKAL